MCSWLFWPFFLTFCGSSRGFVEHFLQRDVSPKCCGPEEFLSVLPLVGSELLYCVPDENRTFYVVTSDYLPSFPWNFTELPEATPCVDVIFDEGSYLKGIVKVSPQNYRRTSMNSDFVPKCCPFNSAYDTFEHKCVKITNETDDDFLSFADEFLTESLSEGFFVMEPGLTKCNNVIADYSLALFDPTAFNEDKSMFLEALNQTIPYGSYCIEKVYNSDEYVARICHDNFDICKKSLADEEGIRCIRKCCPDGNAYIGGGQCRPAFVHGISLANESRVRVPYEPFAIVHGHDCRKYLVEDTWDYLLDEMGNLKLNLTEDKGTRSPFAHSYCFEHVDLGRIQNRQLFLCFKYMDRHRIEFSISRISLTFSTIFLTLTLLGYILLPEMQNLHGKTLMCHCGSLLVAFIVLAVLQFHSSIDGFGCVVLGYVVMYLFLAAFLWSNIMCFDIWWTFGSMKVQGIHQRRKELKRFLWYCLYAWSIPLLITGLAFTVQYFQESVPENLQLFVPDMGNFNCFFEQRSNKEAFLLWFILPIAFIIVCNLVLYVRTIFYCYKVKSEIDRMKDTPSGKNERRKALLADKERMKMVVKLFLIMGIPWLFESISVCTIDVPAEGAAQVVQILFDNLNCLQGVFIFCIFILKVKFIRALQKKLGGKYLRRTSQSTTTTGGTMTTYVPKT